MSIIVEGLSNELYFTVNKFGHVAFEFESCVVMLICLIHTLM